MENCSILEVVGLPCGQAGETFVEPSQAKSEGLGAGEVTGIAVVVVLVLIALLLGAIFYYRRKYKRERVNEVMKVINNLSIMTRGHSENTRVPQTNVEAVSSDDSIICLDALRLSY